MKKVLKKHFDHELTLAMNAKNVDEKWNHLARAHILGQFDAWPHLFVHWKMFILGLKTFNSKEIIGQIPRLILAIPGSLTKRAPNGNTGLSNVGIFTPMDTPEDLKNLLK